MSQSAAPILTPSHPTLNRSHSDCSHRCEDLSVHRPGHSRLETCSSYSIRFYHYHSLSYSCCVRFCVRGPQLTLCLASFSCFRCLMRCLAQGRCIGIPKCVPLCATIATHLQLVLVSSKLVQSITSCCGRGERHRKTSKDIERHRKTGSSKCVSKRIQMLATSYQ